LSSACVAARDHHHVLELKPRLISAIVRGLMNAQRHHDGWAAVDRTCRRIADLHGRRDRQLPVDV